MTVHANVALPEDNAVLCGILDALRQEAPVSASGLRTIADRERARTGETYVAALLQLLNHAEPEIEFAAIWLLRDAATRGGGLSDEQVSTVSDALPGLRRWDSLLNALQMVRHIRPTGAAADAFAALSAAHLAHKRPLIRAWAHDALQVLAAENPALERIGEVARLREAALPKRASGKG